MAMNYFQKLCFQFLSRYYGKETDSWRPTVSSDEFVSDQDETIIQAELDQKFDALKDQILRYLLNGGRIDLHELRRTVDFLLSPRPPETGIDVEGGFIDLLKEFNLHLKGLEKLPVATKLSPLQKALIRVVSNEKWQESYYALMEDLRQRPEQLKLLQALESTYQNMLLAATGNSDIEGILASQIAVLYWAVAFDIHAHPGKDVSELLRLISTIESAFFTQVKYPSEYEEVLNLYKDRPVNERISQIFIHYASKLLTIGKPSIYALYAKDIVRELGEQPVWSLDELDLYLQSKMEKFMFDNAEKVKLNDTFFKVFALARREFHAQVEKENPREEKEMSFVMDDEDEKTIETKEEKHSRRPLPKKELVASTQNELQKLSLQFLTLPLQQEKYEALPVYREKFIAPQGMEEEKQMPTQKRKGQEREIAAAAQIRSEEDDPSRERYEMFPHSLSSLRDLLRDYTVGKEVDLHQIRGFVEDLQPAGVTTLTSQDKQFVELLNKISDSLEKTPKKRGEVSPFQKELIDFISQPAVQQSYYFLLKVMNEELKKLSPDHQSHRKLVRTRDQFKTLFQTISLAASGNKKAGMSLVKGELFLLDRLMMFYPLKLPLGLTYAGVEDKLKRSPSDNAKTRAAWECFSLLRAKTEMYMNLPPSYDTVPLVDKKKQPLPIALQIAAVFKHYAEKGPRTFAGFFRHHLGYAHYTQAAKIAEYLESKQMYSKDSQSRDMPSQEVLDYLNKKLGNLFDTEGDTINPQGEFLRLFIFAKKEINQMATPEISSRPSDPENQYLV